MVLPVASSAVKLALDETAYKLIEEQLDFGKSIIDATARRNAALSEFLGHADSTNLEHGVALRCRWLHPARTPRPAQSQRPWLRRSRPRDEQTPGVPLGP